MKTYGEEEKSWDRVSWENRKFAEQAWENYPDKPKAMRVICYDKHILVGVRYPGEYPRGNEFCYLDSKEVKEQFKANCNAAFRQMWEKARLAEMAKLGD